MVCHSHYMKNQKAWKNRPKEGGRAPRAMRPKELRVEDLDLTISDIARGGAGVSRDPNGQVVFVPYTAPGDRVRARKWVPTGESKDESKGGSTKLKGYAEAELIEVLEPSKIRETPRCPVFGKCGGCDWQHLPYALQWEVKWKGVLHALKRVQMLLPKGWEEGWEAIDKLPAERIWEYRNRIQLRGEGKALGFFRPRSKELVAIDRCDIARPEFNSEWEKVRAEGAALGRSYKVELEVLPSGQVRKSWNSRHSSGGFRQIHDEQNEKLKTWIQAHLGKNPIVFDLFGGSGNLSLPLLDRSVEEVHCVDLGAPLQSAQPNESRIKYYRERVDAWLKAKANDQGFCSRVRGRVSVILDPPREGLLIGFPEIVQGLDDFGVNELVLVGCDADAWARDVSKLTKRGWTLAKLLVIDLFPQTHHVESVALLHKAL